jgi:hypothetical protein
MQIHVDPDTQHCFFLKMSNVRNVQFYYLLPGDRIGRVQEFLSGEVLQVDLIKLKIGKQLSVFSSYRTGWVISASNEYVS